MCFLFKGDWAVRFIADATISLTKRHDTDIII